MSDSKKSKIVEAVLAIAGSADVSVHMVVHRSLPDDHEFYKLVGRVASEWAQLEHTLDLIIWQLAQWKTTGLADAHVACITAQIMGVPGRCKAIDALGRLHGLDDATILKAARKLMNDSYPASEARNRFVHDPWYIEDQSRQPGQFKAMPFSDQRYGVQHISETDATKTIDSIRALIDRAVALRNAVTAELSPSE